MNINVMILQLLVLECDFLLFLMGAINKNEDILLGNSFDSRDRKNSEKYNLPSFLFEINEC